MERDFIKILGRRSLGRDGCLKTRGAVLGYCHKKISDQASFRLQTDINFLDAGIFRNKNLAYLKSF